MGREESKNRIGGVYDKFENILVEWYDVRWILEL
jgi:hypothetical protein